MPRNMTRLEVLMLCIVLGQAITFLGGLTEVRIESNRRTACATNLRVLASAMYIYASDFSSSFPMAGGDPRDGRMRPFAYRNRPIGKDDPPSPSADLWAILRANNCMPQTMICPQAQDRPDPAQDASRHFDFASASNLSYAYTFQYHPARRPVGEGSYPTLPLLADANPYLKGGVIDTPERDRAGVGVGNSLNHRIRKGQNVAYVDGHVAFERQPVVNLNWSPPKQPSPAWDNLYTVHADGAGDPGAAPTWGRVRLVSKSDFCLVP